MTSVCHRYTTTPNIITELLPYEILVFGSSLTGEHNSGMARLAQERYGAIRGMGAGLHGQSYALPIRDYHDRLLPLPAIRVGVENLIDCARVNITKCFLMTTIGYSHGEYTTPQIAAALCGVDIPYNVILPIALHRLRNTPSG